MWLCYVVCYVVMWYKVHQVNLKSNPYFAVFKKNLNINWFFFHGFNQVLICLNIYTITIWQLTKIPQTPPPSLTLGPVIKKKATPKALMKQLITLPLDVCHQRRSAVKDLRQVLCLNDEQEVSGCWKAISRVWEEVSGCKGQHRRPRFIFPSFKTVQL